MNAAPIATAAASSLHEAVYGSRDWSAQLRRRAAALREQAPSRATADAALDLAGALELVEPDRLHAIEMYLLAWKAAHADPIALRRARVLCLEVGQLGTAAKIARIEFQNTDDPRYLLAEGESWLDAGEPDRAVKALMVAARRVPGDRRIDLALATARQEWPDVHGEIARLEREAAASADRVAGCHMLVAAARIIRMLGTDPQRYGSLLARAYHAAPSDDVALALLESFLIERGDRSGLLHAYEMRGTVDPAAAIEVLRRAGTKLALGRHNPGLGLQLITAALDRSYRERIRPIPGHLAMLTVLRSHCESAGVEQDLLAVLARGLTTEQPPVETVGLAMIGLEVAWSRLRDAGLAYPYAAVLARHADQHPSLQTFHTDGGMAIGQLMHKSAPVGPDGEELTLIALDERPPVPVAAPPRPAPPAPRPAPAAPRPAPAAPRAAPPAPAPVVPVPVPTPAFERIDSFPRSAAIDLDDIFASAAGESVPLFGADAGSEPIALETSAAADEFDAAPDTDASIAPVDPEPLPAVVEPEPRALDRNDKPLARISLVPRAVIAALKSSTSRPSSLAAVAPAIEARGSRRIRSTTDVRVRRAATDRQPALQFSTVTRDVSETGLFIMTREPLHIGDRVDVAIDISSVDDWSVDTYQLSGTVVRTGDGGCGIQIDAPPAGYAAKIRTLGDPDR